MLRYCGNAFQLLLVDPKDDEAAVFYERLGFAHLPNETRMYVLQRDLRATLLSTD